MGPAAGSGRNTRTIFAAMYIDPSICSVACLLRLAVEISYYNS